MKKYKRYSAGFKEQALVKVYSRGNDQTIQSIANALNINLTIDFQKLNFQKSRYDMPI